MSPLNNLGCSLQNRQSGLDQAEGNLSRQEDCTRSCCNVVNHVLRIISALLSYPLVVEAKGTQPDPCHFRLVLLMRPASKLDLDLSTARWLRRCQCMNRRQTTTSHDHLSYHGSECLSTVQLSMHVTLAKNHGCLERVWIWAGAEPLTSYSYSAFQWRWIYCSRTANPNSWWVGLIIN